MCRYRLIVKCQVDFKSGFVLLLTLLCVLVKLTDLRDRRRILSKQKSAVVKPHSNVR